MSKIQSFQELCRYFCGMLAREDIDDLYGQILGGVPDMGSLKGTFHLKEQAGSDEQKK